MASHPVIEPLRAALIEQSESRSIRAIADASGVDYRRLLAFSQGGPAAFDALDVDRLAHCLGMRLTYDVLEEPKATVGRKAR